LNSEADSIPLSSVAWMVQEVEKNTATLMHYGMAMVVTITITAA
jgi:hypothetical protein